MSVAASKAVMLPMKSLGIWKMMYKQSVRTNSNLDMSNRSLKGLYTVIKRSGDELNRSLDKVTQSLLEINDTLLEGFNRIPPKTVIIRDPISEQSNQAGQSQQLALNALTTSKAVDVTKAEEEKAKEVDWWKGFETKPKEEKKVEVKPDPAPASKINLKKDPDSTPSSPSPGAKIMDFLKTVDVIKPFNAVKSLGEKAVKAAAKPGDIADWNKLNKNADAALGQIGEKALGALRPVMDTLNKALSSGQFMTIISSMADGFLVVANVIGLVVDGLLWLVGVVQSNWDIIKPILEAISIVYIAAMIVQTSLLIAKVVMLAAAWMVANWPILVVIAVIAILIFIFQKLGISATDVVGAIAGAFGWLKVHLQNVIISLQNGFIIFKDFMQNLLIDPVYAIKKLFYDLAVNFLDIVYMMAFGAENFAGGFMKVMVQSIDFVLKKFKSLTDFLSNIPGFEGLADLKINLLDPEDPHAVSGMIKNLRDKMVAPTSDKPVKDSAKKKYLDYTDTVNAYSQKGRGAVDKFSDVGRKATELLKGKTGALTGSSANLLTGQGGNLNSVAKVGELGSINDSVDISSDDLKMLRELAEIQSIQNFVELTPTVQVTTGNINNAGDIDTIINKIGQKLNEEFVSTAQGVYT